MLKLLLALPFVLLLYVVVVVVVVETLVVVALVVVVATFLGGILYRYSALVIIDE